MQLSQNNLIKLSEIRLQEAIILLENQQYSGAYYLAGYAVEMALKARIAKNFQAGVIPDKTFLNKIYTHNLEELLKHAGLTNDLETNSRNNKKFAINWNIVKEWSEQSRYMQIDNIAANMLINSVKDEENGIIKWLRNYY